MDLFGRRSDPTRAHEPYPPAPEGAKDVEKKHFEAAEEELGLFLVFWLSAVVCPSSSYSDAVRHSLIYAASRLASGVRLALAPRVLCDIYRGLEDMTLGKDGPMKTQTYFPAHDLFGWLGLYFPWVYDIRPEAFDRWTGVRLGYFDNIDMRHYTFDEVTWRLMHSDNLSQQMYRLPPTASPTDIVKRESKSSMSPREKDFVLSLQSCCLPQREGLRYCVQPDFPERFARQFGFDQGIPAGDEASHEGVGPHWWIGVDLTIFFLRGPFLAPSVK